MRTNRFFKYVATLGGLFFSTASSVFAADFPFSDVATSDPIYSDLKKLYERGVVDAPSDGKFHPEALMNRDEFVSIAVGVGCRKCLTPTIKDVLKYREIPFLDFNKKSPYFYCVSYAKEKEIVFWYSIPGNSSYACQDSKAWNGVPFCSANRTSRIEAAAMLLRQAWLWNDSLNSSGFTHNRTFKDVDSYWFGYAQKWTDVGILTPAQDGSVRPDEFITKREFVKMAAIIYSLNMCEAKGMALSNSSVSKDSVSSEIRILDAAASCSDSAKDSSLSDPSETEYNFYGLPFYENGKYSWEFVPADGSGASVSEDGRCLSRKNLPAGRWIARLTVTDASWRSSTSYAQVPYWPSANSKTPLSASVSANPLSVPAWSTVTYSNVVSWGVPPYSFRWDLGDGTVTALSDPRHSFSISGIYPATLVVSDSVGNRAIAKVVVEVTENPDYDGDGVLNVSDSCPQVYGPKSNAGCPVVSTFSSSSTFSDATLTLGGVWGRCALSYASSKGAIFGKSSCSSCPCEFETDFIAESRHCDIFFPAILSRDKKTVYGRGALYEIR